jgi:hypothetical protein
MSCIYLADEFGVCCKDNPHGREDKPCIRFNHGCKDQISIEDVDKMKARLARVEALPEKWRKPVPLASLNSILGARRDCADELTEALK